MSDTSRIVTAIVDPLMDMVAGLKRQREVVAPPPYPVWDKKKGGRGKGGKGGKDGGGAILRGVGQPPKYNKVCWAYSTRSTRHCKFAPNCKFHHTCVSCGKGHLAVDCPVWDSSKDSRPP